MHNRLLLGPWIRRFLLEHLIAERNLSHNTQASYRDTLVLLLPVLAGSLQETTENLLIDDVSAQIVRAVSRRSRVRSFLQCCDS